MCGLAGFLSPAAFDHCDAARQVKAMTDAIRHRGPDAEGHWLDAAAGIALGHRRLSILDLSPAGAQPMHSRCGRYVLAYNGEVYNFGALRDELTAKGVSWNGHSDTEVIVEAIAQHGLAAVLPRLAGMFALALWDCSERTLTLARDPLGIKPLHWARAPDGTVLFGSELKALRRHPAWSFAVQPDAVAALLTSGYIPAPMTVYRGVHKLPPGHVMTFRAGAEPRSGVFWSLAEVATRGQASPLSLSDAEATDALDSLLRQIVSEHLVSDVPLGAFLSGGIDSSTVVAVMKQVSSTPVRTFTIGYGEAIYDESAHAAAVARHLGTDHTELRLTAQDGLAIVPELAHIFDEPFADSSQIPTLLVSRLARGHVTVALSGDGGDELFAGYNRHTWIDRLQSRLAPLPGPLRQLLAAGLGSLSADSWDALLTPVPGMPRMAGNKIHKLAAALRSGAQGTQELYRQLTTFWPQAHTLVPGAQALPLPNVPAGLGSVEAAQYLDGVSYLPDDILVKTDRTSMAVSLETRVPLLDHRLAEFAWRLPIAQRLRDGQGKWLLRRVLDRYVPPSLIDRPKMGFAVPIGAWLKGPLRPWAEDLLSPAALQTHGLLDAKAVRQRWNDHLAGRGSWEHHLWIVLMLQDWWRRWETAN